VLKESAGNQMLSTSGVLVGGGDFFDSSFCFELFFSVRFKANS